MSGPKSALPKVWRSLPVRFRLSLWLLWMLVLMCLGFVALYEVGHLIVYRTWARWS